MPSPDDLSRGRWRFAGDRNADQALFLEAIRQHAPAVLTDLYETVFPFHCQAHRRKQEAVQQGWAFVIVDNDAEMEDAVRREERRRNSKRPRECDFWIGDKTNEAETAALKRRAIERRVRERFPFWSDEFDLATWQSAWDWATRANLSRGMAIDLLKTPAAIEIAQWSRTQPYWRRHNRLPSRLGFPFKLRTSPEITFGVPLLETVWYTLESWVDQQPTSEDLHWALPGDDYFRNYIRRRRASTFTFETFGWDITGGQSRAQAKGAIMAKLEAQVEQQLDEVARSAATKPYLERNPDVREDDQFQWLVLYQVGGLNFAEVTRKALPKYADSPKVTRAFTKDKESIKFNIKRAAERLIGPRYSDWLRPGESGRPRRN